MWLIMEKFQYDLSESMFSKSSFYKYKGFSSFDDLVYHNKAFISAISNTYIGLHEKVPVVSVVIDKDIFNLRKRLPAFYDNDEVVLNYLTSSFLQIADTFNSYSINEFREYIDRFIPMDIFQNRFLDGMNLNDVFIDVRKFRFKHIYHTLNSYIVYLSIDEPVQDFNISKITTLFNAFVSYIIWEYSKLLYDHNHNPVDFIDQKILRPNPRHVVVSFDVLLSDPQSDTFIRIKDLSSGEYNRIALFYHVIYNCMVANDKGQTCNFYIDEPENSLHPRWQLELIQHLHKITLDFDAKFIIATHSPMFLAKLGSLSISKEDFNLLYSVYQVNRIKGTKYERNRFFIEDQFYLKEIHDIGSNIEEVLYSVYEVITPKSIYFSKLLSGVVNQYNEAKINKSEVLSKLETIKDIIYDKDQIDLVNSVLNAINRI